MCSGTTKSSASTAGVRSQTGRCSKRTSPLLWAQQSGHEVDQGRFSGAVLAEEAYNAAGREAECDVVEHLSWAIVIAKVEFMEFDHEMNDCSVMV